MNWIEKLKSRWKLRSANQVVLVLLAFAATGFTVLFLKRPILQWINQDGEPQLWQSILYYVLILPLYNLILLGYGFLVGQYRFFWDFEKRFFKRITGIFKKK